MKIKVTIKNNFKIKVKFKIKIEFKINKSFLVPYIVKWHRSE